MLLVDKPGRLSSHDVVAIARRVTGEKRIGHAGTLDPFATGLLVLLLGRATRLLPYLAGEPKVYAATVAFGSETDTDDSTGAAVRVAPPPPRAALDEALASLTGSISQVPPDYSAKQVGGQRAYAAARRGNALILPPASITVHSWADVEWDGTVLRATVSCSGGTYVRALARDLGRASGSAAHLCALRRLSSGPFHVNAASTLEVIADTPDRYILPILSGLAGLPVETLDGAGVDRVRRGMTVGASGEAERAALVDGERRLVAIAVRRGDAWQPRVVMGDDNE